MIETRIYKCEYCGAEFDDEYEAHCHEWVCRYKYISKQDTSTLKFYGYDGTEIKCDNVIAKWTDFNDINAFTVGNYHDVKFIIDFFEWYGDNNPFRAIEDKKLLDYYGLWWFDPELHYGEWVRVDDQIKKWTDIKNKFIKDA